MKAKLLIPALSLFVAANFSSCNKDNDKSKTELLTQSGWKIIKEESDPGTGIYINEPIDDCSKDDVIQLKADHTYATIIGIKCDPSDTDESGSWALSADEKTLSLDGDAATIETLNGSSLVVVSSETFGGVTAKFRVTFGH